jgi:YHS domain-containing protein
MKNISLLIGVLLNVSIISCNSQSPGEHAATKADTVKTESIKFTPAMIDNKRDPSCGMPVAAGIEDTLHYKNKVLGFCSKECKDEFLKDPEKNIAAADLK